MHSNAFNAKILAAWLTKANAIALGKTWLFDHETYEAAMVQWEFIVKAIIVGSAVVIVASELFRLISEKIAETKTEHNLEKLNSTAIAETTQKAAIGERASLDKYKIKEKEIKMEKEESTANWFLFGNLAATGCYLLIGSYLKTHKEAFAIGFVAAEVGLAAVQLVYLIYEAASSFTDIISSSSSSSSPSFSGGSPGSSLGFSACSSSCSFCLSFSFSGGSISLSFSPISSLFEKLIFS